MLGSSSLADVITCLGNEESDIVEWPKILLVNGNPHKNKINFMDNSELLILNIFFETNEEGMLIGSNIDDSCSMKFELKNVDLVFKINKVKQPPKDNKNNENVFDLSLKVEPQVRISGAFWRSVVQARFYVAENCDKLKPAFSDILDISTNSFNPLILNFGPNVIGFKLEIKYIYQIYHELPIFNHGDMSVYFSPLNYPVLMDRALMSLYSPKLAEVVPSQTSFFPNYKIEKEEFIQLLYKIYRSKCPLNDANFNPLCSAASKLGNDLLLWPLYQNIINDNLLDFPQKVNKAIKLGLNYVAKQLCYNAVKSGEWQDLQGKGFNPKYIFGDSMYSTIVLPSILEAIRDQISGNTVLIGCLYEQKYPRNIPTFDSQSEANDPNNVGLLIDGKLIYINIGILRTFGSLECFDYKNGVYHPKISDDLRAEMYCQNIRLIQIVLPLFQLLYGVNNRVQANLVRACLIFANDHKMNEILLIDELIDSSEKLFNHFILAEKYGLKNLERQSLWQLEFKEYHKFSLEMINMKEYQKLKIRKQVEDRLCNGWAVNDENLTKKEPNWVHSFLLNIDQNSNIDVKSMANFDIISIHNTLISNEPTFKSISQLSLPTAISGTAL